ncbi:MAG TPA: hypothetical protein PLM56_07405 [Cyclobacteriaceae bacterium]|nr:hypothetical protein [Cyclobacteriaceae bacterium]
MRSVILLLTLVTTPLFAQNKETKFGVLADYSLLRSTVNGRVADRYIIYSDNSTMDGFRLGVFGKVMSKRGFWNSEFSYFNNRSGLSFHNLKWEEDLALYGNVSVDASAIYFNRMIRLSVNKGFLIARGLSIEGGIIAALQLKEKHYTDYPDNSFDPATMSKIIFQVPKGFKDLLILGEIRIAYNFGPLSVYYSLERGLTSVSDHVEFENIKYPLEYKIGTYVFGVTYTLFNSKQ